jgi:hypothetical protein
VHYRSSVLKRDATPGGSRSALDSKTGVMRLHPPCYQGTWCMIRSVSDQVLKSPQGSVPAAHWLDGRLAPTLMRRQPLTAGFVVWQPQLQRRQSDTAVLWLPCLQSCCTVVRPLKWLFWAVSEVSPSRCEWSGCRPRTLLSKVTCQLCGMRFSSSLLSAQLPADENESRAGLEAVSFFSPILRNKVASSN